MTICRILALAAVASMAPFALRAQTSFSRDAVEELQSISVRADVAGDADAGRLARLLEDVIRQELTRADILYERSNPRADDCCLLRLDVRLATGSGRGRFGVGYTVRLEMGYLDRLGSAPTWTTVWAGRILSNIVERQELSDGLRFAARELIGDFVDLYREHFPRR